MRTKFNMWASGFCAFCCLYHCVISHSVGSAILTGLFAISNFILGLREE